MKNIKINGGIPAPINIGIGPIIIKAPPPIVISLVVTKDIKNKEMIRIIPKNIRREPIINHFPFISLIP